MSEHIAAAVYFLQTHLLYASLVCCAAWGLTSVPLGSATVKYWIWVAASLNFIVPLAGFIDGFGASSIGGATPLALFNDVGLRVSRSPRTAAALAGVWLLGAMIMFARLLARARVERRATRDAEEQPSRGPELFSTCGIPVRIGHLGPSVAGLFRPYIALPHDIGRLLSKPELEAVLIHEITHARRRDNLLRLFHEVALCGLWFHPLAWVARGQLSLYRELSCDEPVIRGGHGKALVSALAKLADPEREWSLRSSVSSSIGPRLVKLTANQLSRAGFAASSLLAAAFGSALLAGIVGTIAHTACCLIAKA